MKQRKKIINKSTVGFVDYYELKSGLIFIVEYSLESNEEDFNSEDYLYSLFENKEIEITPDADIWGVSVETKEN